MQQLNLLRWYVALQQPKHRVMGTSMELDGDRLVCQRTGVVMVGLRPDQQRLTSHGGAQSNHSGAPFTLVGPTDLTLFSSPVDRDLSVLERCMP